jgi:hypothetical protein
VFAWSLWTLWAALSAFCVGMVLATDASVGDALAATTVGYATVGALVASRHPRNAVGWLLLTFACMVSLGTAADAYATAGGLPESLLVAWVPQWVWYVWPALILVFLPLVFPDGRLLSPRWRAVVWLELGALAACIAGAGLRPGRLDVPVPGANPFGAPSSARALVSRVEGGGRILFAIAVLLAGYSLVLRWRRSSALARQQMKWYAYVSLVGVLGWTMASAGPALGSLFEPLDVIGWALLYLATVVGIPAATGIAIFRHRLYDIDLVIRRTLVYGTLTASLLATYVGCVLLLNLLLNPLAGGSDLAVACSTLASAALFRPARRRIQATVDRRFYRHRYDATRTIDAFTTRLRHQIDLDAVGTDLCSVAHDTVQPAHVSLWIRP